MRTLSKSCDGFTLIEALVALVVLSVGLLGLAMLQITSLQANTDAYYRTQASLHAYEIMDRMRANPTAAASGLYHVPDTSIVDSKQSAYGSCTSGGSCACHAAGAACDISNLALYDLGKWYEEQQKALPQSATPSTITRNGNQHTIVIRWIERELSMQQEWVIEL
jgi:type IV pilus assembly protein PilV